MKKTLLKLKLWWLNRQCPNFWKEFPKENKEGPWVAEVFTFHFSKKNVKNRVLIHGSFQHAYVFARELAYEVDCSAHPDVGVAYDIRRPIEGEAYYDEVTLDDDLSFVKL